MPRPERDHVQDRNRDRILWPREPITVQTNTVSLRSVQTALLELTTYADVILTTIDVINGFYVFYSGHVFTFLTFFYFFAFLF